MKPRSNSKTAKHAALVAGLALQMAGMAPMAAADHLPDATEMVPLAHLRAYQQPVFRDKDTKMLVLEWSRQIGKSHTLAHWAVDRVMQQLGKPGLKSWTVIVISNSKANGAEFGVKCSEACGLFSQAAAEISQASGALPEELHEFGLQVEDCQYRLGFSLTVLENGVQVTKTGRILILAASPRTARGFSADLILDEWAFHENAAKMWAAAEPIISSNPDFLCRVASTHNGPNSLFNRWIRRKEYPVHSMTRSQAWAMSKDDPIFPLRITSLKSKRQITPQEAQAEAGDEREYLQNYENQPSAESGSLLPWDLIARAVRAPHFARDEQRWTTATLQRLYRLEGDLYIGQDVGRSKDVSVVAVLQTMGKVRRLVALLRMKNMRLTEQAREMDSLMRVCGPKVRRVTVDSTGLGTGLVDALSETLGTGMVLGINFSTTVPVTADIAASGRKANTMAVTEKMALGLSGLFDDGLIEIISDKELEDSLHLPERVASDNGRRVSIAAERSKSEDGTTEHADHFWALALAEYGHTEGGSGSWTAETAGAVVTGGSGLGRAPFIGSFSDSYPPSYP